MTVSLLKIGLLQYSPVWENRDASIEKINSLLSIYNLDDVGLLVFPELSLTGFTMKSKLFAEEIDGISFRFFMDLSKKFKLDIFAGIIESYDNKIYNSLIHFDSKGLIKVRYRKIHPFSSSGENLNYSSNSTPVTTKIGKITFGLSICYDLRFPELYRFYGKEKVDVLCNIANWPTSRISHWDKLLQARAIENLSYMIGVNRAGKDPSLTYDGHSAVIDPMGNVLVSSNKNEEIIFADIDTEKIKSTRNNLPFLNDIKLI